MTHAEPTIRVAVDPCNPGEFFACCGLLELADRLWSRAEGWFSNGGFCVSAEGTLPALLQALVSQLPEEVTRIDKLAVKKLIAPLRLTTEGAVPIELVLDAWMTVKVEKGAIVAAPSPPWNFWSGQQTSLRIWSALRDALLGQLSTMGADSFETLFSHRVLLSGRFGFDPGAAWNALDVGFSPNEQSIKVASSPAVELLAAVGLQRFRPRLSPDRATFAYATWGQPLGPAVGATAAAGIIQIAPSSRYLGRVVSRGSYAALGYSIPFGGQRNE
jgi:CRISPR-associated protein Csb3